MTTAFTILKEFVLDMNVGHSRGLVGHLNMTSTLSPVFHWGSTKDEIK